MNDDFRESLKVKPAPVDETINMDRFITQNTRNYTTLYNIPEVREYYSQVVSAILLAYTQKFGSRGISLTYRFKSPKSISNKIQEYLVKKSCNDNKDSQPMYDGFAMKMTTSEFPNIFYSRDEYKLFPKDKTLAQLAAERKANNEFLEKMQEFRSRLFPDEFGSFGLDASNVFSPDVTREEYFSNCIEVLKRTRALTDSNETEVLRRLDRNILYLESNLRTIISDNKGNFPVVPEDINHNETGFPVLLDEFARKMHNEITLAVLTRQFMTLFASHSEFFSQLGISLADSTSKKHKRLRTPRGYESNFIYINTLYETIECQLQTEEQYQQGKTGAVAHSELATKILDTVGIPAPDALDDAMANVYMEKVRYISPSKYAAKPIVLNSEESIVEITEASALSNYESIFSEIQPSNPRRYTLDEHKKELEARLDLPIHDYPERIEQHDRLSVAQYLDSESFAQAQRIAELWHSNYEEFANIYASELKSSRESISHGDNDR